MCELFSLIVSVDMLSELKS